MVRERELLAAELLDLHDAWIEERNRELNAQLEEASLNTETSAQA